MQQEFDKIHENFAKLVKHVDQRFNELDLKFATKDDLSSFATKDDLNGFATKDDLKGFATRDDLFAMELRMDAKFATKADLESQTEDLKAFAEEQTEILAQIIETTVAEPLHQHLRRPAW